MEEEYDDEQIIGDEIQLKALGDVSDDDDVISAQFYWLFPSPTLTKNWKRST